MCQALWVRPKGGIRGGFLLSLMGSAQRQLHDTEGQSELQLHTAINDLGVLLSKLKEGSIKPEKRQKRLIRLIEGPEWLFSLAKEDASKVFLDRSL